MAKNVISVRLDEDVERELRPLIAESGRKWPNRSDVINWALRVSIEYRKRNKKWLGESFYPRFGDVIDKLEFECHREVKR